MRIVTVGPQEYGIERSEKEEIGVLTSLPLLRKILHDLKEETETERPSAYFYLTKESHIQTLVNLVIFSDLKIVMPRLPGSSRCPL
jgi:inositol hexakisphosphate/diphosphoinositol-pentakisphosphate kinase